MVVILIAIALILGRASINAGTSLEKAPVVPVVGGVAFLLGSTFMTLAILVDTIPASLNVAGMLGLFLAGSALFWNWSKRSSWSEHHRLAVAGGLLLTYVWYGFVQPPSTGDTSFLVDTIGNAIFATSAIILLVMTTKRVSASED